MLRQLVRVKRHALRATIVLVEQQSIRAVRSVDVQQQVEVRLVHHHIQVQQQVLTMQTTVT